VSTFEMYTFEMSTLKCLPLKCLPLKCHTIRLHIKDFIPKTFTGEIEIFIKSFKLLFLVHILLQSLLKH